MRRKPRPGLRRIAVVDWKIFRRQNFRTDKFRFEQHGTTWLLLLSAGLLQRNTSWEQLFKKVEFSLAA